MNAASAWQRVIPGHPISMKSPAILLLKGYKRFVSPLLGQHCRFYPSCSSYAMEAIEVHGHLRGAWLAVKRLCRCHPLCEGGHDPVPPRDARPDS